MRKSAFDARYSTFNMMKKKDDGSDDITKDFNYYQNNHTNATEALNYLSSFSNMNDSTIIYIISQLKRVHSFPVKRHSNSDYVPPKQYSYYLSNAFSFGKNGKYDPYSLQSQRKILEYTFKNVVKKDKLFIKSLEMGNPKALEQIYRMFPRYVPLGWDTSKTVAPYIKKYEELNIKFEAFEALKNKEYAKALKLYKKLNNSYYISSIYAVGGDGVPLDIEQSEKYAWESFYNGKSIPRNLCLHFIKTPNPSFKYYFFLTFVSNMRFIDNPISFTRCFNELLKKDIDRCIVSDEYAQIIRIELFHVLKKREQCMMEKIPYVSPLFLKSYFDKSPIKDEKLMKKIVLYYYENGLYEWF